MSRIVRMRLWQSWRSLLTLRDQVSFASVGKYVFPVYAVFVVLLHYVNLAILVIRSFHKLTYLREWLILEYAWQWVDACHRNVYCSGDVKFKTWRKRFLTLTQITQFKSVLCYYRAKDSQPHEFIDLDGFTVDYCELCPSLFIILYVWMNDGAKVLFCSLQLHKISHFWAVKCVSTSQGFVYHIYWVLCCFFCQYWNSVVIAYVCFALYLRTTCSLPPSLPPSFLT